MITPVFTEKTTKLAKEGKYTFSVNPGSGKSILKSEVAKLFGVHVKSIKTIKIGSEKKRSQRGKNQFLGETKKAIVTLKEGEKIDLFHEKPKKNTK